MPKSTPRPTNSTKNATEITLKAPTRRSPAAAEMASPANRLSATALMMRNERSASHRITSTASKVSVALSAAFCLMVPNSSSSIGMRPVWRTRA